MYYLKLAHYQRNVLDEPPSGFPVYFGVGTGTHYVNKMAVTVLDIIHAVVFTREQPMEKESDGSTTFTASTVVIVAIVATGRFTVYFVF